MSYDLRGECLIVSELVPGQGESSVGFMQAHHVDDYKLVPVGSGEYYSAYFRVLSGVHPGAMQF